MQDKTAITLKSLEAIEAIAVIGYIYYVLTGRYAFALIAPKTAIFQVFLGIFFIIFIIGIINLLYRWTLPLHGSGFSKILTSFLRWFKNNILSWKIFLILEALVIQGFLQSRVFKQSKLRWFMHMTLAWGCLIFLVLYIIDIKEIIEKLPLGGVLTQAIDVTIILIFLLTIIGALTAIVKNWNRSPEIMVILIIAGITMWYIISQGEATFNYLYSTGLFIYEKLLYNLAAVLVFIGLTIVFIRRRSKEVKPLTDFKIDIRPIILITILSATGFAGFYLQYISTLAHEIVIHVHFITTFGVIAYFPFSKFLHIATAKLSYILNAVEVHH
ncbi:MAG: hypothetical protein QXJ68_02340 [Methanocellales archaeon]